MVFWHVFSIINVKRVLPCRRSHISAIQYCFWSLQINTLFIWAVPFFCGFYFLVLDTNSCHLEMPNHNKRVDYCSIIYHKWYLSHCLGTEKLWKEIRTPVTINIIVNNVSLKHFLLRGNMHLFYTSQNNCINSQVTYSLWARYLSQVASDKIRTCPYMAELKCMCHHMRWLSDTIKLLMNVAVVPKIIKVLQFN